MNPRYITSRIFERHYKQRISKNKNLIEDFLESTEAFLDDPKSVRDHSLRDIMKNERAFWINDGYRVIYRKKGDKILLVDIGTHEQVYKRKKKT